MVYQPPYRHELRKIVTPMADLLTSRQNPADTLRFKEILDELESLITSRSFPVDDPKSVYLRVIEACKETPGTVTDTDLAHAIAAATVATGTDVLGALHQCLGQTAESQFDQYPTPPNVADSMTAIGATTRTLFDPPTPSRETISGETTLSLFADESTPSNRSPDDDGTDRDSLVLCDPACGSGRLLAAGGRRIEGPTVALGWEIEATTARMAALTLTLIGIPGWIVAGDALHLQTRTIYRLTPDAETPLTCFDEFNPATVPSIQPSRRSSPQPYDPLPALQTSVEQVETAITEIDQTLQAGIDVTLMNPPFADCDLTDAHTRNTNRPYSEYDIGHKPLGATDALRRSQGYAWLFTELAIEFTKPDGTATLILPTSILANQSDTDERKWLKDRASLDCITQLPPETFAPETTAGTHVVSLSPKRSDNVGLRTEYSVYMAIAETIGHDSQADCQPLTDDDGEPVTTDAASLPPYYAIHRWQGTDHIQVPDDDLLKIAQKHQHYRGDDSDTLAEESSH